MEIASQPKSHLLCQRLRQQNCHQFEWTTPLFPHLSRGDGYLGFWNKFSHRHTKLGRSSLPRHVVHVRTQPKCLRLLAFCGKTNNALVPINGWFLLFLRSKGTGSLNLRFDRVDEMKMNTSVRSKYQPRRHGKRFAKNAKPDHDWNEVKMTFTTRESQAFFERYFLRRNAVHNKCDVMHDVCSYWCTL